MDVVYILGTGSKWQDNELRYSLRSLSHIEHGQVFIVGERPDWLQNIIHVPAEDIYGDQKQRNALHKLSEALKTDASEDFILMNDDFFILRPTTVRYAYRRKLKDALDGRAGGRYKTAITNTLAMFPDGLDYSLHIPFIYNKVKLAETISACGNEPVLLRTVYGNMHNVGGEQMDDVKLTSAREFRLGEALGFGDFLSTTDEIVLDRGFRAWIQRKFPEPSQFEICQENQ